MEPLQPAAHFFGGLVDIVRPRATRAPQKIAAAVIVTVIAVAMVAIGKPRSLQPSVDRASIVVDSVLQGSFAKEVRAQGSLVPERIQWLTAQASARVERSFAVSGQTVSTGELLLELSNPDLQMQALIADQQVKQAEIDLVNLMSSLQTLELGQQATIASTKTQVFSTTQASSVAESLSLQRLVSRIDAGNAKAQKEEMTARLGIEEQKLTLLRQSSQAQVSMQKEKIQQLGAIAAHQRRRLATLQVRAPETGVLQDFTLQLGQWVPEGTTLTKIVQPGKLKAVLRVFELQAKDIRVGQRATINTHNALITGHVSRIDPSAQSGTVTIDVALEGSLPAGAVPDVAVEGTIQIERLDNVLHTSVPVAARRDGATGLFKLTSTGDGAIRVPVSLGRSSINRIEILSGLRAGDKVIVSDMSSYDNVERVRLRD